MTQHLQRPSPYRDAATSTASLTKPECASSLVLTIPSDATAGDKLLVTTSTNRQLRCTVPPGAEPGQRIRLQVPSSPPTRATSITSPVARVAPTIWTLEDQGWILPQMPVPQMLMPQVMPVPQMLMPQVMPVPVMNWSVRHAHRSAAKPTSPAPVAAPPAAEPAAAAPPAENARVPLPAGSKLKVSGSLHRKVVVKADGSRMEYVQDGSGGLKLVQQPSA